MAGTFRLVAAGRTRLVELLVILAQEDGLFYRFNHFTPQLERWERETEPLLYRLTSLTSTKVDFESVTHREHEPSRIAYQLRNPDTLVVTLTFAQDDPLEPVPPIELVLRRQPGG